MSCHIDISLQGCNFVVVLTATMPISVSTCVSGSDAVYLSALKIQNFRQFGQAGYALEISFNEVVTALVGENDAGKTAAIDAIRYLLQTRDAEYMKLQLEDFHIDNAGAQADAITLVCMLWGQFSISANSTPSDIRERRHACGVLGIPFPSP